MLRQIEKSFPRLVESGYLHTSPATPNYNCVAFTLGDCARPWWPRIHGELQSLDSYWPEGAPVQATLEAFIEMYRMQGFEPCADGELESGNTKVALYVEPVEELVEHAALQLPNGRWISKIGVHEDIAHTLEGLTGPPHYWTVGRILRCPLARCSATVQELITRYSAM